MVLSHCILYKDREKELSGEATQGFFRMKMDYLLGENGFSSCSKTALLQF